MNVTTFFTVLSVVIIAGMYAYMVYGIVSGDVKLNFTSQALWATIDVIVAISLVAAEGAFWQPTFYASGSIVMAICISKTGFIRWERFDTFVAILAMICVVVLLTSEPRIATIASTIAMVVAGIPQLMDCWKKPHETPVLFFLGFFVANTTSVFGGTDWSIEQRLFPVAGTLYCGAGLLPFVINRYVKVSS